MRLLLRLLFFVLLLCFSGKGLNAQNFAVKTNLLYDMTTTLNLGVEVKLAPKWTVDVSGNYNPFTFSDNVKIKHWLVQPEMRYWFCESFNGHFLALHALGGVFNVSKVNLEKMGIPLAMNYRYEGEMYGAGIGYGYQFVLGKRWNLGLELGLGWVRMYYEKFDPQPCGRWLGMGKHDYFGPTKAAISLIYIIK